MTTIAPAAAAPAQTEAKRTQLFQTYDMFLTLLTTQLQNQDPLEPMDSTQFTQQLVQFASVEQSLATNTKLDELVKAQRQAGSSAALSYLGRAVEVDGDTTALDGGRAEWSYTLAAAPAETQMTVTTESGRVVWSGRVSGATSGANSFVWDGRDSAGNELAPGAYRLAVNARDAAGKTIDTAVSTSGTVTEIDLTGTSPYLMLGPVRIDLDSVRRLKIPPAAA